MRYYNLDKNGWPLASYARPQPDKDLQHLSDQPSEHHRWNKKKWVEDKKSKRRALEEEVRRTRDRLIKESDWTVLPDSPVSNKKAWKDYRQELRDVTKQEGFPENVEWPRTKS